MIIPNAGNDYPVPFYASHKIKSPSYRSSDGLASMSVRQRSAADPHAPPSEARDPARPITAAVTVGGIGVEPDAGSAPSAVPTVPTTMPAVVPVEGRGFGCRECGGGADRQGRGKRNRELT